MRYFDKIFIFLNKIKSFLLDYRYDRILINQGIILNHLNTFSRNKKFNDYEFQVFSQWGEDGLIQFLINNVNIENKTFIEFGVSDFRESNCRFLMMKDNWSGYVLDSSFTNINKIINSYYFWKYDLKASKAFITKNNLEELLDLSNFNKNIGIISIDIDGMDYYVFEALNSYKSSILICEFNSLYGPSRKITTPYTENFNRTSAHYSNLYWGASLGALDHLATKKGYSLIGINSAANNAFFVKNELLNEKVKKVSYSEIFTFQKFRESRNSSGQLNYLDLAERLAEIKGLPVLNVETMQIEEI